MNFLLVVNRILTNNTSKVQIIYEIFLKNMMKILSVSLHLYVVYTTCIYDTRVIAMYISLYRVMVSHCNTLSWLIVCTYL